MKMHKTLNATDREAWRAWLAENHGSEREVWLIFPKIQTKKVVMSYEDAVGEALCYSWIDSIVQRLDDKSYARKFTPRTDNLRWSELNKRRVAKLIRESRMTEIGLAKVGYSNPEQTRPKPKLKLWSVPGFIKTALQAQPKAWANFSALAASHQSNYVAWIMTAKREETRQKRLEEAIQLLRENRKLGLK